MELITNSHWREFVNGYELPENLKDEFDYMDDVEEGVFILYNGWYHDLSDFMRLDDATLGVETNIKWDACKGLGFFESLVISISNCGDMYKIGRCLS